MDRQTSHRLGERTEVTPATGSAVRLSSVEAQRFDEYLILARIGQGGMAEVLLGLSDGPAGFQKLVAIKRLHGHLQDDPEAVEMFQNEANIAARLQHPNIVHTHKAGCFEGRHFITMEYLEGQPLNRVLRRMNVEDARLPPVLAVRLIADALEGLHHAHELRDFSGASLSLIHRDISPHNLFVTVDGHVKLIDFGVAKVSALPSQTRTGLIKGKLTYMPPEQALGEALDRRADIWSIGVTLRECLSGQRLFCGGSDLDMLRATLSEEITPLHEIAPEVPAELSRIVDRALQRDRRLRFASALELKEELEGWLLSQGEGRSRAMLAATMRALFHDVIEQRHETIRTCLVRAEARRLEPSEAAPAALVHTGGGTPEPEYHTARSSRPGSLASRSRIPWKAVTLLGAAALAATIALAGSATPAHPTIARAGASAQSFVAPRQVSGPAQRPTRVAPAQVPAAQPAPPGNLIGTSADRGTVVAPGEVAASTPPTSRKPSTSRGRRATSDRKAASVAEPQVVVAAADAAQPASKPESQPSGRLVLDSTPYAIVSIGSQRLGITPLDVELSATTHILTLRNPELGIETTYRVTIPPRGSVRQRVALD